MAWTLGSVAFATVDNQIDDAGPVDREITRPGVDGTAFQTDAWRANPAQVFVATMVVAAANLDTQRNACRLLLGTTATLQDQFGTSYTVYVRRLRLRAMAQLTGDYLLQATWTLCPATARPTVPTPP